MAVPPEYFIILVAYGLWLLSIIIEDEIIALISSFLMFGLSVYVFAYGIDIFTTSNLLTMMFGGVTFALAVYTSFQATQSLMNS